MSRRVLLLAVAVAVVAGCTQPPSPKPATTTTTIVAVPVERPKPSVTPGVVITTSATNVCTPGWAAKHRRGLTAGQKAGVLKAYGYPAGQKVAEWDHLLSLELGGGNGPRNIFPMIDPAQAHRKDLLENRLNDAVCAGKMSLKEAQSRIKTYWQFW